MRRQEKEIFEREAIEAIIHEAKVCRLGLCHEKRPYVIPLCFGYEDNHLYFHTAPAGRKLEILAENDRVCFELEGECRIEPASTPCRWSMSYRSVIGFGRAHLVDDRDDKQRALDVIMDHYAGPQPGVVSERYIYRNQVLDETAVIEVVIDTMTGKQSGF